MRILSAQRPKVEGIGKGLASTLAETVCIFEHRGCRYKLVVFAGFLFDGASIPQFFWTLLGLTPHGDMDGPSLFHDFPYHYQGVLPEGSYFIWRAGFGWVRCTAPMSRATADLLMEALCRYFKVTGTARAWMVWAGVRAGGHFAWKRNDETRKFGLIDQLQGETP